MTEPALTPEVNAYHHAIRVKAGAVLPTLVAVSDLVYPAPWPVLSPGSLVPVVLGPDMSQEELGTAIASSLEYWTPPATAVEMLRADLDREYATICGGLAAIGADGTVITPGCCIGLEDWRDWFHVGEPAQGPWLGHGPPERLMRDLPGGLLIGEGPNEDLDIANWADIPVVRQVAFTHAQFAAALRRVAIDIESFATQVKHWAARISPEIGSTWAEHWLGNLNMLPPYDTPAPPG